MRNILLVSCLLFLTGMPGFPVQAQPTPRVCPDISPEVFEIRQANPLVDRAHHDRMVAMFREKVNRPNTTILLGPNVVLDFSHVELTKEEIALIYVGACVTIASTSVFPPDTQLPAAAQFFSSGVFPGQITGGTLADRLRAPARTSHSLGPLLKFGPHRSSGDKIFFFIGCHESDVVPSDNVRISGFRLHGPSFSQQSVDDTGIKILRCLNVEISNMEIAGWGGQAVQVEDKPGDDGMRGPGQVQPNNLPGERIGQVQQVRIFHNYIHHNQHPTGAFGGHANGYGVEVSHGAWAQIYENVFDFNRHAIAATWDAGGYEALRNLVLKGGGVHNDTFGIHTHQFDIHGEEGSTFKGGQAGVAFLFANNSFQYLADNAIYIRGRPHEVAIIRDNIFAHEGLEDDWGDDAIKVQDRDDLDDVIKLGPSNVIDFDSYGSYDVCDFDGDRIDDLFLATGRTWWYSSFGEFHWTYLSDRTERLEQVRLGYFDDDLRCDVLTESGGEWLIASGGTGPWQSIGTFNAPLKEVVFGRFDPNERDQRPGVTRQTTHAFRRTSSGEWQVTHLSSLDWQRIGSSSFPMERLRFGDFTGDGVTDVLAVENGRWAISRGGINRWERLNRTLSDDVRQLLIADLNHNNVDDLIRLESQKISGQSNVEVYTWWVSDDGRTPWRKLKSYVLPVRSGKTGVPVFAFAGRFGLAPGGGVLLIDHLRIGHFYSEAEIERGASPEWTNLFSY